MKYIMTSQKLQGKVLVEFTIEGLFKSLSIENEEDSNMKLIKFLFNWLPPTKEAMKTSAYQKHFFIDIVPPDLSFEAAWDLYAYKVGNKERAKRLWNALSEHEKALAMAQIVKYKRWLSTRNQAQAYFTTWLNERRFENQY